MIFLKNLVRSRLRNLITIMGIAGGIAVFVVIGSVSIDLRDQVTGAFGAYDADVIVMNREAATPFASRIENEDFQRLRDLFGDAAQPLVLGHLGRNITAFTPAIGISAEMSSQLPLVSGEAAEDSRPELLLGLLLANRLRLNVGDQMTLGGSEFYISGIFHTGSRLVDGAVIGSLGEISQLLGRHLDDRYSMAMIRSIHNKAPGEVVSKIHETLPNLSARSSLEFAGGLHVFRIIESLSGMIMVMAFLGVCLVLTNALLMTVSERTREIGVFMSIGWTPWMIMRMLLAETLVLCVVGVLLGNLSGHLILLWLNAHRELASGWVPTSIDPSIALLAGVVAVGAAFVSLLWPAVVIHRIQPIETLRYE